MPVNDCDAADLNVAVERVLREYFENFLEMSFHQSFNCPRSVSVASCAQILGKQSWTSPLLVDLLQSEVQILERVTFDLLATINSTLNPVSFVCKYYIEKNLDQFFESVLQLSRLVSTVNLVVNRTISAHNSTFSGWNCLMELNENLQAFFSNPFIKSSNKTFKQIQQFISDNDYFGMYDGFALQNTAMISIRYLPYTIQRVVYPADYNFWSFLAEFGGVLSLYFGVTVITLYESVFFLLSEPEVQNLNLMPEKKFDIKTLYKPERTEDEVLTIPY